MKKLISVVLAAIMILSLASVTVFALSTITDDITDPTTSFDENVATAGAGSAKIAADVTISQLQVQPEFTLTVEGKLTISSRLINYGTLIIKAGGAIVLGDGAVLENYGSFTIKSGGGFTLPLTARLNNRGTVTGLQNDNYIKLEGKVYNFYTLPTDVTITYPASMTFDGTTHTVTFSTNYVRDEDMSTDTAYLSTESYSHGSGAEVGTEVGKPLYVLIRALSGGTDVDFVDTTRLTLNSGTGNLIYADEQLGSARGRFIIIPRYKNNVLKAETLTVATETRQLLSAAGSASYDSVIKQFKLTLPRNEKAYYTITEDGRVDDIIVNYGEVIRFRVVLSDKYDNSADNISVFAGSYALKHLENGYFGNEYTGETELDPDDYGYYTINYGMTDDGVYGILNDGLGIRSDVVLTVKGIISNEMNDRATSLLGGFREMINIFKRIISYFADLFSGAASLSDIGSIFGG